MLALLPYYHYHYTWPSSCASRCRHLHSTQATPLTHLHVQPQPRCNCLRSVTVSLPPGQPPPPGQPVLPSQARHLPVQCECVADEVDGLCVQPKVCVQC
jgi:hypothetical protein